MITRASLRSQIAEIRRHMDGCRAIDLICRMDKVDADRLEIPIDAGGLGTFEGITIQITPGEPGVDYSLEVRS